MLLLLLLLLVVVLLLHIAAVVVVVVVVVRCCRCRCPLLLLLMLLLMRMLFMMMWGGWQRCLRVIVFAGVALGHRDHTEPADDECGRRGGGARQWWSFAPFCSLIYCRLIAYRGSFRCLTESAPCSRSGVAGPPTCSQQRLSVPRHPSQNPKSTYQPGCFV